MLFRACCLGWDESLPQNVSSSSAAVNWAWSNQLRCRNLHRARWPLLYFPSVTGAVSARQTLSTLSVPRELFSLGIIPGFLDWKKGGIQMVLHSCDTVFLLWVQKIHLLDWRHFYSDEETVILAVIIQPFEGQCGLLAYSFIHKFIIYLSYIF